GVPVSALVFIPWIPRAPVVPAAQRPHNRQALFNESLVNQVRCDLVLDPSPHLVRVDKRQSRLTATRPAAKQQPRLMSHGVTRPLRVGMYDHACLEVVAQACL